MTIETWKDIPGTEGRYQASSLGRIRSMPKYNLYYPRVLHQAFNRKSGRLSVMLCLEEGGKPKRMSVHRLVALAFVPNPDPERFTEINHKDEDHANNVPENLEWCDRHYNMTYGTIRERINAKNVLRRKPVDAIKNGEVVKHYDYLRAVLKDGFDTSGVWHSIHHQKAYKGLMWRYANANQ